MDIQKELENRKAFENLWIQSSAHFEYFVFSQEHGKYIPTGVRNNLTDQELLFASITLNTAYLFFLGGIKTQAIPEGFVLVPKSEMSDWYLDDSESMYLEYMDHWACEIEVGEVVAVERKKAWDIPDQYVAKVYADEDNIEWQLFDDEASAQKAADHCKAMIQAVEDKSL